MKYNAYLLFGAPGSGKGTQGKILGSIPGFLHLSTGEIFRSLNPRSTLAQIVTNDLKAGRLVADEVTLKIFKQHVDGLIKLGQFNPKTDAMLLDGIPRNVAQCKALEDIVDVKKVLHLVASDREELINRMRKRAIEKKRMDDANDKVMLHRIKTYEKETLPVLAYYDKKKVVSIDALRSPLAVLKDILKQIRVK